MNTKKIRRNIKTLGATILIPIVLAGLLFLTWSYFHKLYTDHNTYCTIIRVTETIGVERPTRYNTTGKSSIARYNKIRKSSIVVQPNEYLEFVSPANNAQFKFVGSLNYAVICPTNLHQEYVDISTAANNSMQQNVKEIIEK